MKKNSNIKLQLISLIFFAIYFIGLFFPWFSAPEIKSRHGTLILTAMFPIGIISISTFIILNIISIVRLNKLYMHIINIFLLIILVILSLRLLINWGGLSEYICLSFYISNSSIILSLIFYIINLYKNKLI